MGHKIRVKMLTGMFHPVIGGAERQALLLGKALMEKEVEVSVVTTCHLNFLPKYESIEGLSVTRIPFSERFRFGRIGLPMYAISLWYELFRNRHEFDILHAHLIRTHSAMGIVAAKLLGKKAIVKGGCAGEDGDIKSLCHILRYGKLCLRLNRIFDRVVAVSKEVTQELAENNFPYDRIHVIPNGVDTEHFKPITSIHQRSLIRKKLAIQDCPTFCFTGRLSEQKQLDLLLRAVAKLVKNNLRFQVLLVGDGPRRKELQTMANDLGIFDFVTFFGERNDIDNILMASDVFVLTSRSEGLSNSLLEAMSCGLTPIASEGVSGVSSLIQNGVNGLTINPGYTSEFASVMHKLLKMPNLCLEYGRNARETVLKTYSIKSVADKYINLYKEMLSS